MKKLLTRGGSARKIAAVVLVLLMMAAMTALVTAATADQLTDISTHWAASDITALVNRGMFVGETETLFNPNNTMSRAMVATVLYRYDGQKAASGNNYTDVVTGAWYEPAVLWAAANHIIEPVTGTRFAPNDPITRETLAAALYNYARYRVSDPVQTLEGTTLRLSTTTSVNDSGLLPYLQPEFEKDTGYKLEVSSAGTGAAIEKGRTGDADALLVHAKATEEGFINEGYGELRLPFMYNFFVIIGPAADPAGVKTAASASDAFTKIANTDGAFFVSRGDNSGTHTAENNIWKAANITPTGQDWYVSTGQGMGASINVAAQQGAYILTDKATYLAHASRGEFEILMEENDQLINTYSVIDISTNRWDDANAKAATAFIEWINSKKAAGLIDAYGVAEYGEQLFYTLLTPYTDDAAVGADYLEAVNWAVGVGIINGNPNGTIVPQGNATRAEVVTMLSRFLALIEIEQ